MANDRLTLSDAMELAEDGANNLNAVAEVDTSRDVKAAAVNLEVAISILRPVIDYLHQCGIDNLSEVTQCVNALSEFEYRLGQDTIYHPLPDYWQMTLSDIGIAPLQ